MQSNRVQRVGYVVKRYPRFSETFVVNEMLSHEAAGWELEIFSLRPPCDTHFQDRLARVRAGVTYLPQDKIGAAGLWQAFREAAETYSDFWTALPTATHEDVQQLYQAIVLAQHVRELNLDHLHAHFATSAAAVTRLAARFSGVPYTLTAHAKDIFHEDICPDDLQRKLEDAEAVVTVSDFNLEYLRERFPGCTARIERVYNGLDLDAFEYQDPLTRPRRIVAVGRLVEKKGFCDLIDACAELDHKGVDFSCDIVGTGDLEHQLRAQIADRQLEGKVRMLGARPQAEVKRLVQGAAVLAAPCLVGRDGDRDGMPTVLLEAMALGTPCVATDVTGIPELVKHGLTGWLVPQGNTVGLAVALEALLDKPTLRMHLAKQARSLIEQEFDVHRNAGRLREIIQSASGSRRQPAQAVLQKVS